MKCSGFLMDPLDSIDITKDSTFLLMLEAVQRGQEIWYFTPHDIAWQAGRVVAATAHRITVQQQQGAHWQCLETRHDFPLESLQYVFMRQDPPFDMAYITATYLLERLTTARVINNPRSVRDCAEKIYPLDFPSIIPPTLLTRTFEQARAFREQYQDIIIKPLYGCGGGGVFHLPPESPNLEVIWEVYLEKYREPLVVQQYLPAIRHGDKRVILLNGNPIGAVARMPNAKEHRANFHAGGVGAKADLNERDLEICTTIAPSLREKGLLLVGIDIIGSYLTEINVTSPTGLQQINALNTVRLEKTIWDTIENIF